jgi:PilZ domain
VFAGIKTLVNKQNEFGKRASEIWDDGDSFPMPPDDRRATPRFQPKPDNCVLYNDRSVPIRDLSMEGVFVLDPDPLPVGSEIAFTLRAGHQDIALEGVVRHSEVDLGMGIQFANLSAVSKRRLIIHLASLVSAPSQLVESK